MSVSRWIGLLLVAGIVAFVLLMRIQQPAGDTPAHGLPWQIQVNDDGSSTVFGITLGKSRLGEASQVLGNDRELAIIAASDKLGNLEMYYGHFRAGLVSGKLVLQTNATDALIRSWKNRSHAQKVTANGSARKYYLANGDLEAALRTVVTGISFVPAIALDEEIILARFGEPAQRIRTEEEVEHFLYPALGLDIAISADRKDVLQYVAPAHFARLQQPLE